MGAVSVVCDNDKELQVFIIYNIVGVVGIAPFWLDGHPRWALLNDISHTRISNGCGRGGGELLTPRTTRGQTRCKPFKNTTQHTNAEDDDAKKHVSFDKSHGRERDTGWVTDLRPPQRGSHAHYCFLLFFCSLLLLYLTDRYTDYTGSIVLPEEVNQLFCTINTRVSRRTKTGKTGNSARYNNAPAII